MIKYKILLYRWLVAFSLLLASTFGAAQQFYPMSHNTPMMSTQGELQLGLLFCSPKLEFQSAYAITNRLGVMVNGGYSVISAETNMKAQRSAEVGAFYFIPLKNDHVFELSAGGGYGKIPYWNSTLSIDDQTSIVSLFVQPAYGFLLKSKRQDYMCNLSLRYSSVTINDINRQFLEPGFMMKSCFKALDLAIYIGYANDIKKTKTDVWQNIPITFGIGIQFYFGRNTEEND